MAGLQTLPLDIHIMITKLLNLRECLIYSQLSRVTFDAVYYVFSHRKQLDFGSVLGADKSIVLPDSLLLKVLHAHTRAEVITGFCVSRQFDSFTDLEGYMEKYWHIMESGDNMVGHEAGRLENMTYPRDSHYGATTRKQGDRLKYLWDDYSDEYGVFGITSVGCGIDFPPLNNAPSNWSTFDLDQPYSRDYPPLRWTSERIYRIKYERSCRFFKEHHRLPTSDEERDMDY
jgi:hypothetical protein